MAQYLKNKDLLAEIIKCKETGVLSETLAGAFLKLAQRYGTKPNFASYTFREDMVADAALNLCQNWHKFDETRFTNAFAYYTQAVHNSFIQYLNKEKRHRMIRDELLTEAGLSASWSYQDEQNRKSKDDKSVLLAEEKDTDDTHW